MALANFCMLIHELLNKYPYIVTEEDLLIILDSNYSVCMAKDGKDTKHTRHISRRIKNLSNGENTKCTRLTDVKEICNWHT